MVSILLGNTLDGEYFYLSYIVKLDDEVLDIVTKQYKSMTDVVLEHPRQLNPEWGDFSFSGWYSNSSLVDRVIVDSDIYVEGTLTAR